LTQLNPYGYSEWYPVLGARRLISDMRRSSRPRVRLNLAGGIAREDPLQEHFAACFRRRHLIHKPLHSFRQFPIPARREGQGGIPPATLDVAPGRQDFLFPELRRQVTLLARAMTRKEAGNPIALTEECHSVSRGKGDLCRHCDQRFSQNFAVAAPIAEGSIRAPGPSGASPLLTAV
jgi:hypothetical protein